MIFSYVAKNIKGDTLKSELEAKDKNEAITSLRQKGLFIIKLEEEKKSTNIFNNIGFFQKERVSLDKITIFTRQLSTMIESGITIVDSLDVLLKQMNNKVFKKVLKDIHDQINKGSSLSDALTKHKSVFSSYFINMVKAGECSGMLDVVLKRIAIHLEKTAFLQNKIKSAMTYPIFIVVMAFSIVIFMLLKVVPVFEKMFSGFNETMPGPTRFIINVSNFGQRYFLLFAVFCICGFVFLNIYKQSYKGRYFIDNFKLKIPFLGVLLNKIIVCKFTRTLGTLLKSGVPIISSLDIVSKAVDNAVFENTINNVKKKVQEGESIVAPLEKSKLFPSLVLRMIGVGEMSGELEKMLEKVSDFFDDQINSAVSALTSIFEPLIIGFLGLVIGGIVLSMFLPILQISKFLT